MIFLNKKVVIISIVAILILAVLIFFLFFYKNTAKDIKNGNNMNNQEVVDYFLNISSYTAKITVEVNSNKNQNKYILNQEYIEPNTSIQEVVEPSNIAGVKITRDESGMKIENTSLSLTTIFENYNYIGDNCLDLSSFIETYKTSNSSTCEEISGEVVMKTESNSNNKYTKYRTLYIDKQKLKPTRLKIENDNQKCTVNILYNEVEINS